MIGNKKFMLLWSQPTPHIKITFTCKKGKKRSYLYESTRHWYDIYFIKEVNIVCSNEIHGIKKFLIKLEKQKCEGSQNVLYRLLKPKYQYSIYFIIRSYNSST